MLRSAIVAVRSTVLQPENFRQLNSAQISRLIGTQLRLCSAQSSPDTNSNSSKDDRSPSKDTDTADQKTSEVDTKASDSEEQEKESQHDRLLKEKESLIKDLQVRQNLVRSLNLILSLT